MPLDDKPENFVSKTRDPRIPERIVDVESPEAKGESLKPDPKAPAAGPPPKTEVPNPDRGQPSYGPERKMISQNPVKIDKVGCVFLGSPTKLKDRTRRTTSRRPTDTTRAMGRRARRASPTVTRIRAEPASSK